ncbi:hypothetical protein ADK64_32845 [Streptomyces sp. MMG1121]|nr:hypothetical protein ADK64_32845 [Streptomyces sp. MMG1121]
MCDDQEQEAEHADDRLRDHASSVALSHAGRSDARLDASGNYEVPRGRTGPRSGHPGTRCTRPGTPVAAGAAGAARAIRAVRFGRRGTVTLTGARLYVFAVIEHASRRVRVLGATAHPPASWVVPAAKNPVTDLEDAGCRARFSS